MSILIATPSQNLDHWKQAMRDVDPSIEVFLHNESHNPDEVEFALAWNHPHGIFSKYPNLSCISSMGAGVDHLLEDKTIPGQIEITRLIDPQLSQDMFEFVLAAIMNSLRGLTRYSMQQAKGFWKKHSYSTIEKTKVGIMGTGAIGNHVAVRLLQVGFKVTGWSRSSSADATYPRHYGDQQLADFLKKVNILVCLLPLTDKTRGIINRKNLQQLPRGSWLINLGRGQHVVEQDLLEMLDSGHLEGANLDVFSKEPLPEEHPFWKHDKIYITPHIASLTSAQSVAPQIIENYNRCLQGLPLLNRVDREKGY
jgi:glyoxylate/hydroxypyruvate reductase